MLENLTVGLLDWGWDLKGALDSMLLAIAGKTLDKCLGKQAISTVIGAVSMTTTGGGKDYSLLWQVVTRAFNYTIPFGYALLVTYFLIYMMESATRDQISLEMIGKTLIQLILVVALIGNLELICNCFLSMAESILFKFSGGGAEREYANGITITGEEIANQWFATGEDTSFTIMMQSFLIYVFHYIANIGIYFAAFSRLIELGWRIAFAPVGVANCFDGGSASPGIKYLKSILAVSFSGAAIYVVAACGYALSASLLASPTPKAFLCSVGAQLATAGAAIGVGAKCKEIVA